MALYANCHYAFHKEFVHGYLAMFLACFAMICLSISYHSYLLRPDDLGKDVDSVCFRACLSVLLVHLKGGRPRGARVVTSYTGVRITGVSDPRGGGGE